jgi:hypothetical protein
MRKTTFILFVLCLGFTACKKENETGNDNNANLKVTATIPSSGFHFENALVVTAVNSTNTSVKNQKTILNGGTAEFNLNVGHYYVYIDAATNSSDYELVHSNYGSQNSNFGQEVDVAASSVSTLTFTKWCQGDTSGNFYCN